ncbi:MAG: chemotaxis protein CheD [Candidatus Omnitrophica bacterium]|nr:chemotaxis protein CheD [Candidatus Omnitrophota bacterium]
MPIENKVLVGVGDIKIDKAPAVLSTFLGSCVAVCLYSPSRKVGGMVHYLLPKAKEMQEGKIPKKEKYADTGIPELLRRLKNVFNIEKDDFVAKIFGGANVLRMVNRRVGEENVAAARAILRELKIVVVSASTGGEKGYKLDFNLATGKVSCQIFNEEIKEY